jgi:hypothetical protein
MTELMARVCLVDEAGLHLTVGASAGKAEPAGNQKVTKA